MNYKQRVGKWGETLAETYLIGRGLQPLYRNYRTPYGEIDIVMEDKGDIVFIEVKTRTSQTFGFPENSITQKKCAHLVAAAEYFFQEHPERTCGWRVDVIAIEVKPGRKDPDVEWFENAIS
jgi:putative endonuclease